MILYMYIVNYTEYGINYIIQYVFQFVHKKADIACMYYNEVIANKNAITPCLLPCSNKSYK